MVKDRAQAEDIVQEVYIKILKSYHSFRGDSSEKTWIFSIARHTTYDFFRKQTRYRDRFVRLFSSNNQSNEIKDNTPLPEEIVILDDEMQQLYKKLELCSTDQKQVIILRYIQSFSIEETANILGWSTSKVKTTQHRAIKKLRQILHTSFERGK